MKQNSYKKTIILTSIITLLPVVAGILLWNQLPDRVATHFGEGNIPNGWSDKGFAVFGIPIMCLVLHLLCALGTLADPKKDKISEKILKIVLWIVPVVSIICAVVIYGYALSVPMDIEMMTNLLVGIVFLVIGNYMPKCKQNYTVGIKISWTLDNEENWNRTHRFAGWLYVLAGLYILLNAVIKFAPSASILPVIIIAAFAPMIYSFAYYVRHKG